MIERGELDSAIVRYKYAIRLFDRDEQHAEDWVAIYNNLGYLQIFRAQYIESFNNLLIAKEISRQNHCTELSAFINLNLATLYSFYDDQSNMFDASVQAFKDAVDAKAWPTATAAFTAIVSPLLNNPQQATEIKSLLKVWDTCQIPDTVPLAATCRHKRLAAQSWLQGDYNATIRHLQDAKASVDDWANPEIYRFNCDYFIIDILRRTGQLDKAIALSKELLAQCDGDLQAWHMGVLQQLGELYGLAGQPDSAMVYQTRFITENDSLMKGQQYTLLRNIEEAVRTQVQEQREAEQRRKEKMLVIWLCVAVGFLVVVAAGATVIGIQYGKLRQRTSALYQRNTEILSMKASAMSHAHAADDNGLMAKVNALLEREEVVADPNFSIPQMAQMLDVPLKMLSRTINAATGDNFSVVLANARVAIAARKLGDRTYDKLTVEAVGRSVGFMSRSNFAVIFRRATGMNPSEFRKQSIQQRADESNHGDS